MPIANPMVQGGGGFTAGGVPPGGEHQATAAPSYEPPPSRNTLGGLGGGISGPDNTNVQVAALVTIAFLAIVVMHWSGFRFAVDAGVTRS